MANQRKSYRNVLATAAGAAVVASAMAPGAVAADEHTAASQFPDVAEGMTHYDAINELYQQEIIMGYEDGSYHPYASLTRIQAALMLERAKGLESDGDIDYDYEDVPGGYEDTVDAVTDAGYFEGSVDGDFDPYEELTREQMAKVLVEAYDLPMDVEESDFSDRGETALLQDYIDAVAAADVASGFPDGSFGVGEEIKRLDFAAMLWAAMNYEESDDGVVVSDVGNVEEIIPGANAVELDLSDYEVATDANVQIKVGDEMIDLPYDEERGTFVELQVTGYDVADLEDAVVYVDGEPLGGDTGGGEPIELGTVADLDGSVETIIPGATAVELDLLANENVDEDSQVSLQIDGETVADLPYDADRGTFVELQVTGYDAAELEAATVVVQ